MDWKNRYTAYFDFCKEVSLNDDLFAVFKRQKDCTDMLEHVSFDQGIGYIEQIKKYFPYLLSRKMMQTFSESDDVGSPFTHYFEELDMELSPSILRYMKVLGDLNNLCLTLSDKNIIEIGGGYGGQCKIINDWIEPRSYTIVDHPSVLLLTQRYLNHFGISANYQRSATLKDRKYDLCISNYAFTELDRSFQELYVEKIINNSERGYITCNWFGVRPDNGMTKEEIEKLKPNGHFIPEVPVTGINNCIYIWE